MGEIRKTIGPAIERDTAMPITPVKSYAIGPAIERDTAMPVTVVKSTVVSYETRPPKPPRWRYAWRWLRRGHALYHVVKDLFEHLWELFRRRLAVSSSR